MKADTKEQTGIEAVSGNTIVISDLDKFNKHLEKKTAELKKEYDNVGKEPESVLKIEEVSLHPIHLACGSDDLRPNIRLIQIKNNIATATNGNIVVKIDLSMCSPLTPDMIKILNGKYIHASVWAEMSKCETLYVDDSQIVVFKNGINKIFEYSLPQMEFFNTENLIQDIKEAGEEPKRIICYTPSLISIIHKIFKSQSLQFSFTKGNLGTIVFPYEDSGMFAVLMPCHNEEVVNRYLFI